MNKERLGQLIIAIIGAILGVIAERKFELQPPICPKPLPEKSPEKAPPPEVAPPTFHPLAAIGRIQFGSAGCTATVIFPQRTDGQYDVLTAHHCIARQPKEGRMVLRDGRSFAVRVRVSDPTSDIAWLVSVGAPGDLPTCRLAKASPSPGTEVWHAGFGSHLPGNIEKGTYTAGPNSEGQSEYRLSVSPGDSGGGIIRHDTGECLSPVCCTTRLAGIGRVWGGSPESCWALR